MTSGPLRIGTRGSALALAQARSVAGLLEGQVSHPVEVVTVTTGGGGAGDGERAGSAGALDGGPVATDKSRWVAGLEQALLAGEVDLAVHSAKDVPGELADGLALLGAPPRAAAADVLCLARPAAAAAGTGTSAPNVGLADTLAPLPSGARVGTSSVRRAALLRAAREDLEVVAVRGNVDTRLRRLADPDERLDALVLARAGLLRLGREGAVAAALDPARFVPAPGQGTLALEGRAADEAVFAAARTISDEKAFACLQAERALAHALGATCHTPLGAYAHDYGCGCIHLRAWVGLPDGSAWVTDELLGGFHAPEALGRRVAERLLLAGAGELLRGAEESAVERA